MDGRLVINHLKNLKTRYCETENRIPKFKDLNVSWKWWYIFFVSQGTSSPKYKQDLMSQ